MSSQRRGSRWQRNTSANRGGVHAPVTWFQRAVAGDGTARPIDSALVVTNSLQKDRRLARLFCEDGDGLPIALDWAAFTRCTQANPTWSSLSLISFLSGSARFHLTLPQAPAGARRWAERHDGKGNLHFKHAA
jgi:hypothetical protein